ncbi:MAG TPA: hypothetical protein VII06_37290 [Chloroflexota bacterium]
MLQQVFPDIAFEPASLQFVPLEGNVYVVVYPGLFWGPDALATAEAYAQQLGPGWSAQILDGPLGYGVYLVFTYVA